MTNNTHRTPRVRSRKVHTYNRHYQALLQGKQGAFGKLVLPKIMERYEKVTQATKDLGVSTVHFKNLIMARRTFFQAPLVQLFSQKLDIPEQDLLDAYQQDTHRYANLRSGFPELIEQAGHLGKIVLSAMEEQKKTIVSVIEALGIKRVPFRQLMVGKQTFFTGYGSTAEVVMKLAHHLGRDPIPFLEAYILDAQDYYADLAVLLQVIRETNGQMKIPATRGKRKEEEVARLIYFQLVSRALAPDDWKKVEGILRTFVEPSAGSSGK